MDVWEVEEVSRKREEEVVCVREREKKRDDLQHRPLGKQPHRCCFVCVGERERGGH